MSACLLMLAAILALLPSWTMAGTTITTYTYNADGALTAFAVQADDGTATTTYVTWDNFTPDAADPSTGTLTAPNGRLLATGAAPGGHAAVPLRRARPAHPCDERRQQ